jgi:hypothetical protein
MRIDLPAVDDLVELTEGTIRRLHVATGDIQELIGIASAAADELRRMRWAFDKKDDRHQECIELAEMFEAALAPYRERYR